MKLSYFLYAEDDDEDVVILKEALRYKKGLSDLISVPNGFDLLTFLQEIKKNQSYPNLIILDLQLPRLSGLETLRLLKSDDMYRLIPVMVFAGSITHTEMESCNLLGADVMLKPSESRGWNQVVSKMCAYIDE